MINSNFLLMSFVFFLFCQGSMGQEQVEHSNPKTEEEYIPRPVKVLNKAQTCSIDDIEQQVKERFTNQIEFLNQIQKDFQTKFAQLNAENSKQSPSTTKEIIFLAAETALNRYFLKQMKTLETTNVEAREFMIAKFKKNASLALNLFFMAGDFSGGDMKKIFSEEYNEKKFKEKIEEIRKKITADYTALENRIKEFKSQQNKDGCNKVSLDLAKNIAIAQMQDELSVLYGTRQTIQQIISEKKLSGSHLNLSTMLGGAGSAMAFFGLSLILEKLPAGKLNPAFVKKLSTEISRVGASAGIAGFQGFLVDTARNFTSEEYAELDKLLRLTDTQMKEIDEKIEKAKQELK